MAGYNTGALFEPGFGLFGDYSYTERNSDEAVPESHYVQSSGQIEHPEFQGFLDAEIHDYHKFYEQPSAIVDPRNTMSNPGPSHAHMPTSSNCEWEERPEQDSRAHAFPHYQYYGHGASSALQWHSGSNSHSALSSDTAHYADAIDEQTMWASRRTQELPWTSNATYHTTSSHQSDPRRQSVLGPRSFSSPPVHMQPTFQQGYGMAPTVSHHSTDQLQALARYPSLNTSDKHGRVISQDVDIPLYSTSSDIGTTPRSDAEDSDMDQDTMQEEGNAGKGLSEQDRVGGDRRPRLPMSKIPFEATAKVQSIYDERGQAVPVILRCDMPRTFGYLDKEGIRRWVAYRRNYFQPLVSIELEPPSSDDQGHLVIQDASGHMTPVLGFRARLRGYNNQNIEVEMVVFTAKRKPLYTGWGLSDEKTGPAPVRLRPTEKRTQRVVYPKSTGDPGLKTEHKFERPQFKASTDNNGMRRSGQTYYHVRVEVEVEVQGDERETKWVLVAFCCSGPLITRGRSPKSFEAPQPDLPEHNRRRKDGIKAEEPRAAGEKAAKVRKLGTQQARTLRKRSSDAPMSRERPRRRTRASQTSLMSSHYGQVDGIKSELTEKTIGDVSGHPRLLADDLYISSARDNQFSRLRTTRSRKEIPSQLRQRVPGPPENGYGSPDSIAYSDTPGSDEDTDDPSDPTYGPTFGADAHFRRQSRHQ